MTYGLSTRVFVENGPAAMAIEARSQRSSSRVWRALDHDHRIALIDSALKPANDLIDAYPLAL